MRTLLLASTSPWRRKMLADAGVFARGEAPSVGEHSTQPNPAKRAIELARRKAHAVLDRHPEALVLGADQVVTDGTAIWGKPANPTAHLAQLQQIRGASHRLVTGWCLVSADGERIGHATTRMVGRADLADEELQAYVATGEGSGCAGGYAAEGMGAFLFERVDGDWNNVLGLPLFDVVTALRELGWRFTGKT